MTLVTIAGAAQAANIQPLFLLRRHDADIGQIYLYSPVTDALDQRQILRVFERTVFLTVLDNGFCLGQTDAVQFARDRLSIGRVDVDGTGKCPQRQTGCKQDQ